MFKIKIEPSGHQFEATPDETVLEAALRHGISLPYSCRGGNCGSCKAKVKQGQIEYQHIPDGISSKEKNAGFALLCQAYSRQDLVIESREIEKSIEIEVRKFPCRVQVREQLNHDVLLIKLKLPGTDRMQFLAGQYINFILKDGRHRSFSIANAPHDDEFIELHIRHIPGGEFTSDAFEHMHEKDMFRIEGPLGYFYLRENSERPIIFMAGGTGFAPIKGIIEHALAKETTRPMYLYWGARTLEDLYMRALPEKWAREHENIHFIPVLSHPKPEDNWQGKTGLVHEVLLNDFDDLSSYELYGSGPPKMVYAGRDVFPDKGLDLDHYFSDAFEFQRD